MVATDRKMAGFGSAEPGPAWNLRVGDATVRSGKYETVSVGIVHTGAEPEPERDKRHYQRALFDNIADRYEAARPRGPRRRSWGSSPRSRGSGLERRSWRSVVLPLELRPSTARTTGRRSAPSPRPERITVAATTARRSTRHGPASGSPEARHSVAERTNQGHSVDNGVSLQQTKHLIEQTVTQLAKQRRPECHLPILHAPIIALLLAWRMRR